MPKVESAHRLQRLLHYLSTECGGNRNELARRIGRSPSQTNDMLNGRKSFGEKIARAIEDQIGKPHGWLDLPDGYDLLLTQDEQSLIHNLRQLPKAEQELLAAECYRRAAFWVQISDSVPPPEKPAPTTQ